MNAKTNSPKSTPRRCECSNWEFGTTVDLANGDVDFIGTSTECGQMTTRTFAQGHDAKLVGFLVRAELDGLEIHQDNNGITHVFGSAVTAAGSISGALADKAANMLEAASRRKAQKAAKGLTKKVAKDEIKAAVEATQEPRAARIKVGRWTYDAMIATTGIATYRTRLGATHLVDAGAYTEI